MHGNKGKKLTEEHRKKLSRAHKGIMPKVLFLKGHKPWNKNKKGEYSLKHLKQFKKGHIPWNKGKEFLAIKGERNNKWKGGITSIVMKVRNCFKYRQWASDILYKDNFICQICSKRGGKLEVDHFPKMFSEIWREYEIKTYEQAMECEEFWNINNGRTLCKECHRRYGKK